MLSALDKEQYWRTVEACLVEILGMDAAEAYQKVLKLRIATAEGFNGESLDIAYHDEPINVAIDLAGYEHEQFDYQAHKDQYTAIRDRYMPIGGNIELERVDDYLEMAKQFEVACNYAINEKSKGSLDASQAELYIALLNKTLEAQIRKLSEKPR